MFSKEATIQSEELGDVYHRVSGQARRTRGQQDVPGGPRQVDVAGNHSYYGGLNPAPIKRVCLNNEHRPPISRLGMARFGTIGPPDLPALNFEHAYQTSFASDFSWARCKPESTFAECWEYTSFKRSVIEFSCCAFRNSAIALAYNSLLEIRRRRAVASATRKSSSGNDTAVFTFIV